MVLPPPFSVTRAPCLPSIADHWRLSVRQCVARRPPEMKKDEVWLVGSLFSVCLRPVMQKLALSLVSKDLGCMDEKFGNTGKGFTSWSMFSQQCLEPRNQFTVWSSTHNVKPDPLSLCKLTEYCSWYSQSSFDVLS